MRALFERAEQRRALAAVGIAYLAVQFAFAPISAVLPTIVQELDLDAATSAWIVLAYLVSVTAFLLPAGRLGDLTGHARTAAAGMVLLGASSTLASLAPSLATLLVLRGVQGLASALTLSNGLAIIADHFPERLRGRAIGLAIAGQGLGNLLGPLIATNGLELLGWRWLFLVPAPLAAVCCWNALRLPRPARRPGLSGLDFRAAPLLLVGLGALSLGLSHPHQSVEPTAHVVFEGLTWGLAALALALFAVADRRAAQPLLPLGRLRGSPAGSALLANGVLHMVMMATFYLTPFYVEWTLGLGPTFSGTALFVAACVSTMALAAGGWVHDRLGTRRVLPASAGGVTLGLASMGILASTLGYAGFLVLYVWLGLSMGAFITASSTAVMGWLPAGLRGISSGLIEGTRQFGHSLGVGLVTVSLGLAGITGADAASRAAFVTGFQYSILLMAALSLIATVSILTARLTRPAPATSAS